MKKIIVIGAGRSAYNLLEYLSEQAESRNWNVTVIDRVFSKQILNLSENKNLSLREGNVLDSQLREEIIPNADLVISMLPASLHIELARDCLRFNINLLTASYVSDEMRALSHEVERKGLLFMNECGLDPGIDHMSAMKVIDGIRSKNLELTDFETFTGGLLSPESHQDNPWAYKFTWNPRNVVLAGQGVVKFIQEGRYKYIPYHRVFRRTEQIFIEGYGYFDGYANRDSLKYLDIYGLRGIKTIYRGTLRRPGFCRAWDVFVQLGCTDDSYKMEGVANMSHRQFLNSFLSYNPTDSIELKLAHYLSLDREGEIMNKIKWLGLFEETPVGLNEGSPAQILEHILKKKWTLSEKDKDMIVMWHKFNYMEGGVKKEIHSRFVAVGEDSLHTGMSKTVGLPLALVAELMLESQIDLQGVRIPIHPQIYNPVLEGLKNLGFDIFETEPIISE